MPSVTIPCPVCDALLLLDEENAGAAVACPECESRLRLPTEISDRAVATLLSAEPKTVHRLPRSGMSMDEETAPQQSTPAGKLASKLPVRRKDADELRRLAALGTPGTPDVSTTPAPPPDPNRERTALPEKRRVENLQLGESAGSGRPKRDVSESGVPLPTRRTGPLDDSAPPISPIAARGDVNLAPSPLPESRATPPTRPFTDGTAKPPLAPGPAVKPTPDKPDDDLPKGGHRLGAARRLHFSPKTEATIHDPESGGVAWGTATDHEGISTRRLLGIAILVLALLGGAAATYLMRQKDVTSAGGTGDLDAEPSPLENVEKGREVLARFLAAKTVEAMAAEVRHPDITLPRMQRYYAVNPLQPRTIRTESPEWNESRAGDIEFITTSAELDNFRTVHFALEIPKDGDALKLDWESYVNWAEIPWKDFLKTPPDDAVDYRVSAVMDEYYNYMAKDKDLDWLCFKLIDPEDYASCWGYCQKDTKVGQEITFQMRRARQAGRVDPEGRPIVSAVLRLRFPPEGKKTNQVMIESLVHDSWILP